MMIYRNDLGTFSKGTKGRICLRSGYCGRIRLVGFWAAWMMTEMMNTVVNCLNLWNLLPANFQCCRSGPSQDELAKSSQQIERKPSINTEVCKSYLTHPQTKQNGAVIDSSGPLTRYSGMGFVGPSYPSNLPATRPSALCCFVFLANVLCPFRLQARWHFSISLLRRKNQSARPFRRPGSDGHRRKINNVIRANRQKESTAPTFGGKNIFATNPPTEPCTQKHDNVCHEQQSRLEQYSHRLWFRCWLYDYLPACLILFFYRRHRVGWTNEHDTSYLDVCWTNELLIWSFLAHS